MTCRCKKACEKNEANQFVPGVYPPLTLDEAHHEQAEPAPTAEARQTDEASILKKIEQVLLSPAITLTHIPKGARPLFCKIYTDLLKTANISRDIRDWLKLMMFPKTILRISPTVQKKETQTHAQKVMERLRRWELNEEVEMWKELEEEWTVARPMNDQNQTSANIARCKSLVSKGRFGDAMQALSSNGVAAISEEVLASLLAKHPQIKEDIPDLKSTNPFQATTNEIRAAALSFKNGSCPGGSGLRADHLKDLLKIINPIAREKFEIALTDLCNTLLRGEAPNTLGRFIAGAPVIPLLKPDGGIRPIAIGETLRRLVSKAAAFKVLRERTLDLQYGVGRRNGGEAILHAVSNVMKKWEEDPGVALLKIDFANAFNTVSRKSFFEQTNNLFPELSSWISFCYQKPAMLWTGQYIYESCTGVQQGDPLGPLLFSLALQVLIFKIEEKCPELMIHAWYLDDGVLIGPPDILKEAFDIIRDIGRNIGLIVGEEKCEMWNALMFYDDFQALPIGILRIREAGVKLLGGPVGSSKFAVKLTEKRVDKIKVSMDRLNLLEDAQMEFCLLRACVGFPKMVFTMRTTPTETIENVLKKFDSNQRETLAKSIGGDISDKAWEQATLPIKMGGLGLTSVEKIAPAAFIGSIMDSADLQNIIAKNQKTDSRFLELKQKFIEEHYEFPEGLPKPQSFLTEQIHQRSFEKLKEKAINHEKARLFSVAAEESGAFLTVTPIKGLDLWLPSQVFASSVRYRLGMIQFDKESTCPACNKGTLDVLGDHATFCNAADRNERHNEIVRLLASELAHIRCQPQTEPKQLILKDNKRPDILIKSWNGQPTALDITIVSPVTNSNVN